MSQFCNGLRLCNNSRYSFSYSTQEKVFSFTHKLFQNNYTKINIYSCDLISYAFKKIEKRFVGRGYGDFKREVADAVCDLIGNIQTKYQQFKNPDVLNTILTAGAERACIVASETLNRAKVALGLK